MSTHAISAAFSLAVLAASAAYVSHAANPGKSAVACPAPHREPPVYPPGLMRAGVDGVTVLVLTADACGSITQAIVETSSGYDELDAAALVAARTWKLGPQAVDRRTGLTERRRVPIAFTLVDGSDEVPEYMAPNGRPRDPHFEARRTMRQAAPQALPDGKLPGHVADAFPIGVTSVAEAVVMLGKFGTRQPTLVDGVDEYLLFDAEGFSRWFVMSKGSRFAPSVYRLRAVGDDRVGFFVASALCEAVRREHCSGLDRYLAAMPAQAAMPPPPMRKLPSSEAPQENVQPMPASTPSSLDTHGLSQADTTILATTEGSAVLLVTFDARGNAIDLQIERSSGLQELDRAALLAARRWRLKADDAAARMHGGTMRVPVQFKKR